MEMLVRDLLAYTQVTRLDAPLDDIDMNVALAEVTENLRSATDESVLAVATHGSRILSFDGSSGVPY